MTSKRIKINKNRGEEEQEQEEGQEKEKEERRALPSDANQKGRKGKREGNEGKRSYCRLLRWNRATLRR